ncbi:hypothetical protein KCP78_06925 [Salmonella enterica subsp. enterica]|nr:hypothetical protein KCP78_06925 [Salmonella enterica subsp. enterica]
MEVSDDPCNLFTSAFLPLIRCAWRFEALTAFTRCGPLGFKRIWDIEDTSFINNITFRYENHSGGSRDKSLSPRHPPHFT